MRKVLEKRKGKELSVAFLFGFELRQRGAVDVTCIMSVRDRGGEIMVAIMVMTFEATEV